MIHNTELFPTYHVAAGVVDPGGNVGSNHKKDPDQNY